MWTVPTNINGVSGLLSGVNGMLGNDIGFLAMLILVFAITFVISVPIVNIKKGILTSVFFLWITSVFGAIIFQANSNIAVITTVLLLISIWVARKHD